MQHTTTHFTNSQESEPITNQACPHCLRPINKKENNLRNGKASCNGSCVSDQITFTRSILNSNIYECKTYDEFIEMLNNYDFEHDELYETFVKSDQAIRIYYDYDFSDEKKDLLTDGNLINFFYDITKTLFNMKQYAVNYKGLDEKDIMVLAVGGYGKFEKKHIMDLCATGVKKYCAEINKKFTESFKLKLCYEYRPEEHKLLSLHFHYPLLILFRDIEKIKAAQFLNTEAEAIINQFDQSVYNPFRLFRVSMSNKTVKDPKTKITTTHKTGVKIDSKYYKYFFSQTKYNAETIKGTYEDSYYLDGENIELIFNTPHIETKEEITEEKYKKADVAVKKRIEDYAQSTKKILKQSLEEFETNIKSYTDCYNLLACGLPYIKSSPYITTEKELKYVQNLLHEEFKAFDHANADEEYIKYCFDLIDSTAANRLKEINYDSIKKEVLDEKYYKALYGNDKEEKEKAEQEPEEIRTAYDIPLSSFSNKKDLIETLQSLIITNWSNVSNYNDYNNYTLTDFICDSSNKTIKGLINNINKCCFRYNNKVYWRDSFNKLFVLGRENKPETTKLLTLTQSKSRYSFNCVDLLTNCTNLIKPYENFTLDINKKETMIITRDELKEKFDLTKGLISVEKTVNHIKHMCGGDEELFKCLMTLLSFSVIDPVKVKSAPAIFVFTGRQGAGKTSLAEIMSKVSGWVVHCSLSDCNATYNSIMRNKTLIFCDEVDDFKGSAKDWLKKESGQSVITIKEKFKPEEIHERFQHFIFTSNKTRPLQIEEGDRRIISSRVILKSPEYYKELYKEINNELFGQSLYNYLMEFTQSLEEDYVNNYVSVCEEIARSQNTTIDLTQPVNMDECFDYNVLPEASKWILPFKELFRLGISAEALKILWRNFNNDVLGDSNYNYQSTIKIIKKLYNIKDQRLDRKINGKRIREHYLKFDIEDIKALVEYKEVPEYYETEDIINMGLYINDFNSYKLIMDHDINNDSFSSLSESDKPEKDN